MGPFEEAQGRRGSHFHFSQDSSSSYYFVPETHEMQQELWQRQGKINPRQEEQFYPQKPQGFKVPYDPRYSAESQEIHGPYQRPRHDAYPQQLEIPALNYNHCKEISRSYQNEQNPENFSNLQLSSELSCGRLSPHVYMKLRALYQAQNGDRSVLQNVAEINANLVAMNCPYRLVSRRMGTSYEGKEMLEIIFHGKEPEAMSLR